MTPLSRHELDGQLFNLTRSGFRHNFVGGHGAELVIDGQRRPVVGTLTDTPALVARRMRAVLDEQGTRRGARALGLQLDGDPVDRRPHQVRRRGRRGPARLRLRLSSSGRMGEARRTARDNLRRTL